MKKRAITMDDYVYQIVYNKRVPAIKKRSIVSLTRGSSDSITITFMEEDLPSSLRTGMKESHIYYSFKGENWVEKDRGETITCSCTYDSWRYWLSLEEAQAELEKRKQAAIEEVEQEIMKLKHLIEEIKASQIV